MKFLTESAPERDVPTEVAPGVRRIVANNPGPMTYHGTNTYLLDTAIGCVVLDPGPDDAAHVAAIVAATGGEVARIVLTHGHTDHTGAVPGLREATGAETGPMPEEFAAIPTPGHAADHMCFARGDGVVFSGDHVMSWSTTVVRPPGGNMSDYFASVERMLARPGDHLYLPGHGPPMPDPRPYVEALLAHRIARENAVLAALSDGAARTPASLVAVIYGDIAHNLRVPAESNISAHLEKLERDGRVVRTGAAFARA